MTDHSEYEIMSMVSNPDNFLSWPSRDKIEFYKRVVDWHDYIAKQRRQGHVSQAWGTQTLPGMSFNVPTKITLIALYRATMDQYSELMADDPLWNFGVYNAPILKSIEGDYEDDKARNARIRARLQTAGHQLAEAQVDFLDRNNVPQIAPGGSLEVLVTFRNTDGFADLSDVEKLAIDERVLQMHQYHQILRDRGVIVKEWGCYQNLGIQQVDRPCGLGGRHIYRVNNYGEFDSFFLMDPLFLVCKAMTLVLLPLEDSRERYARVFKAVEKDLRD